MNRKERAEYIGKVLKEKYPEVEAPLKHKDAYTLLVAVVLSARCMDARVNEVTPGLFELADNPRDTVKLGEDVVRKTIRRCGLSSQKARAIIGLSRILVKEYGGEVPGSFEALESLPGVGHKTASVVMVQWFGEPAFPVDTHIYRLARRWRLSESRSASRVEKDLKEVFPKEEWGAIHLRFIYFGREECRARGCDGKRCEICQVIN